MQHLDEGTIHAWLDDALPAAEAERVAEHAATCRECAARVADARGLVAGASRIVSALDSVPGNVIPIVPPAPASANANQSSLWRRLRLTPARAALAATLLFAVASMISVQRAATVNSARIAPTLDAGPSTAAPPAVVVARPPAAPTAKREERASVSPSVRRPKALETQASPAPAAPSVPGSLAGAVVAADTPAAAPRAIAVDSTRAGVNRQMRSADVGQRAAFAGAGQAPTLEGCYRVQADSTTLMRGIPERFALDHDAPSGQNVVRRVLATGRADSVLAGSGWTRTLPNAAVVHFAGTNAAAPVTMQLTLNPPRALASSGSQTRYVNLNRTDCVP